MNRANKYYEKPVLIEVTLVPEEAVLEVCKHHEVPPFGPGQPYCSWPPMNGGQVCRGVTGS